MRRVLMSVMSGVLATTMIGGLPGVSVLSAEAQTVTQRAPKLVWEFEKHDFGIVDDAGVVSIEFPFRNEGNAALTILNVETTCGCTAAKPDKDRYEPGEGGTLTVGLKTQNKKNKVTQYVTVTSDDPTAPRERLEISAEVVPLVDISVRQVRFGALERGQIRKQTVVVTGPTEEFAVIDARSARPDVFAVNILEPKKATITDRLDGDKEKVVAQYIIEVTTTPDTPVGRANAGITLSTNLEEMPEIQIGASAEVKGDIGLVPARMGFGAVPPAKEIDTKIRVASKSGQPFEIKKMVPMFPVGKKFLDTVEFELVPDESTREELPEDAPANAPVRYAAYDLVLKGTAPETPMPVRGFVVLNTDARGEPVVRVSVSGVVRKAPGVR